MSTLESTRPPRGFDAALATFPTRVVALSQVIDLLPISHAPERVAEFRRLMTGGERFPPIAVIPFAGRLLVADGHKRLTAYVGLNEPDIVVEVWTYRRWLRDQWAQALANAGKNRRILARASTEPAVAWRLLLTTLLHWRRVAVSLFLRASGRV